jgi:hypothetical protein
MSELFDDIGADYLEQLLQAAIHGKVAQRDPAGGQIVGSIMLALVSQGAGDRVDRYLRRTRDRPSVYELTCFNHEYRPVSRVDDLVAADAVCLAAKMAAARPTAVVALVTRDDTGREHCVLLAKGSILTFQFAGSQEEASQPDGDGSDVSNSDAAPRRLDGSTGGRNDAAAETGSTFETDAATVGLEDDRLGAPDEEETTAMLRMITPSAAAIADLVVKGISAR